MNNVSYFKQILLETIKFVNGRDDDYFYKNFGLITLTDNGSKEYKLTPNKKTAGLAGHAAKHLIEIDREFVANVIYQIKRVLINHVNGGDDQNVIAVYKDGRRQPIKTDDLIKTIKQAPFITVANTLDMINDKRETKQPLNSLEQEISVFLDQIAERYKHYIEQTINKAVDIDKIDDQQKVEDILITDDVVKFSVQCFKTKESTQGIDQTLYLDLEKQVIMFVDTRGVHSAFRIGASLRDRKEAEKLSKRDFITKFVLKYKDRIRFYNLRTMRALYEVGNIQY